jgi:hypothetical protein
MYTKQAQSFAHFDFHLSSSNGIIAVVRFLAPQNAVTISGLSRRVSTVQALLCL